MVATQVIVVGHHSRVEWIGRLQKQLPATAAIVDYADSGARSTHIKALQLAEEIGGRAVIMEDDAIPVADFRALAEHWHRAFPEHVISFYLGTNYPPQWQPDVDSRLRHAND